jgi:hypothetical protein
VRHPSWTSTARGGPANDPAFFAGIAAGQRKLLFSAPARIALLVALLLALSPSAASAFSKAIWGPVNQFPLYKQLGVSIYEAGLSWNQVATGRPRNPTNPKDPAYQWPTDIQQAIDQANRFHMRVMLQIVGTPGWANGGRVWEWAPKNPGDYAAFAAAAAREYPSVHLWMIWGEPSRSSAFQPLTPARPGVKLNAAQKRAPHIYARLLDAAYVALKRVSARNLVIGGCTYTTGNPRYPTSIDAQQWIENLRLPNGHPPRMDMYAHNPFSAEDPNFSDPPSPYGAVQFSDLPRLARWVDRYLHRGIPLFLSEWTIPTCPDTEFNFYVDPHVAARWVSDALRLSRHWKRIYALGWIHLYDDTTSCGGLLTASGTPKPMFYAFEHG